MLQIRVRDSYNGLEAVKELEQTVFKIAKDHYAKRVESKPVELKEKYLMDNVLVRKKVIEELER